MCSVPALIRAEELGVVGADVLPTALLTTGGLFPHSHVVRGQCGQVTTVPQPEANIHGVYFEYVF